MALAEDKVRESLKQVIDPELFVNIVDLGLIYVVEVSEENEEGLHDIHVEMTMTSPMCLQDPNWYPVRRMRLRALRKLRTVRSKWSWNQHGHRKK